jgi:hypothetical protein
MALYAMNTGCSDRNQVKHLTNPFVDHTVPQLQQMAHELLGRAALHQGLTTNATDHFSRSDAAASRCPSTPATPSLMNQFVRFEIPTQRSIAWLDNGHLGEHPSHQNLDDLIGHLDRSPTPLDKHESFLLLIMKNTQARRLEYLGRHNGCKDLIQQSWVEVTRFHDLWGDLICSYAIEELERRDSTMARQQNQVVDVLASSCMFDGDGHLTRDGLRGCEPRSTMLALINDSPYQWQATSPSPDPKWDMFDLLAWLKFHWAAGSRLTPDVVRHGSNSAIEYATDGENKNSYPVTSVFEWLMRPEYEGQVDQQEIGDLLANSTLFKPQDDGPSIFRILALRAARHLDLHAITHSEVIRPHTHEAMSVYFDKLQEDPTTVIARCPY